MTQDNEQLIRAIEQLEKTFERAKNGSEIAAHELILCNQFRLGLIPSTAADLPDVEQRASEYTEKHICPRMVEMGPDLLLRFSRASIGFVKGINKFIGQGSTKLRIKEADLAKIRAAQDYRIKHEHPAKKGRVPMTQREKLVQAHMKTIGKTMYGLGSDYKDRKKGLSDLSEAEFNKCKELAEQLVPNEVK